MFLTGLLIALATLLPQAPPAEPETWDVVVYGDLNPGAEVIAGGNILVFGAVKGMAHAGARGNDGAHIVAFDFRPTQLRIGRKIAIPPESRTRSGSRQWTPEVAWVQGGEIIIDPYQGRLPS